MITAQQIEESIVEQIDIALRKKSERNMVAYELEEKRDAQHFIDTCFEVYRK
jgi:hypothetical protein